MTFFWPHVLWLLILPAALLARELARRRGAEGNPHPRILRAEAGLRSVSLTDPAAAHPGRGRRPRLWLCAGLALSIVALARPQWGRIDEPVFDQSREILIGLDLSRSMLTHDVKPSRLERSKLLIQSLLDRLKGERVGLVVFSGTAFLQSPLSADYEILREFLPTLGPDFLPEGGTNYRDLLETSIDAFGNSGAADRYLILLSDGEATDDDWRPKIAELKTKGIRVIGLGVGTASGGMIPDGSGGFMKDETGAVVMSKLESGTLRELAGATGGAYRDASAWVDLPALLASTVETGRKGRFVEHTSVRYAERFQWALAPALLCFFLCFWREFPVRPKNRDIRLSPAPASPGRPAAAARRPTPAVPNFLLFPLMAALVAGTLRGDDAPANPASALTRIVGRLAGVENPEALDWAELAGETVTWGHHLQSAQQPVPEGPVRDALAAVETGMGENAKAADWNHLRSDLEALLQKPEEPKKQPQKQPQQNQSQDQQQQQKQQQQSQQNQKQNSPSSSPQSGSSGQPKPEDSSNSSSSSRPKPESVQNQEEGGNKPPSSPLPQSTDHPGGASAFGDLKNSPTPPPEATGGTQQVGGTTNQLPPDAARGDPALAVPLEKLQRLRDQDSPAELFQLFRRGEPTPPPDKKGKNW